MKSLKSLSYTFMASVFFLMGLSLTYSEAQPPFIPPADQRPQIFMKETCRKDPSITFTGEQLKKLESLGRAFLEETKPLRDEMMDLRLELRLSVSDPQIQSQVLLDKQRRMSSIQAQFENLRVSYLVKARAIFTKDQLERFPVDCPLKIEPGYGVGKGLGRILQRGSR